MGTFVGCPTYDPYFDPQDQLGDQFQHTAESDWNFLSTAHTKDLSSVTMAQRTPPPDEPAYSIGIPTNYGTQTEPQASNFQSASRESSVNARGQTHRRSSRPTVTVQEVLMNWIRHSIARNVNPMQDKNGMNTLAAAHDLDPLDVATFVGANARGFPDLSADRMSSEQPAVPSAPSVSLRSSQETYDARKAVADKYVTNKSQVPCNMAPALEAPGGLFHCPYAPCNFGHSRHDEWKRHLESRQPQQVYVCYLCYGPQGNRKDKRPSVEHRRDKHMKHLRDVHKVEDTASHLPLSCFEYSGNFTRQCIYRFKEDGRVCGATIDSWGHQIKHLAAHYKSEDAEAGADAQESDGEGSIRSSTGKRSSATPQPLSRKKRNGMK